MTVHLSRIPQWLPDGLHVSRRQTFEGEEVIVTRDLPDHRRLAYRFVVPIYKKAVWVRCGLFRFEQIEAIDFERIDAELQQRGLEAVAALQDVDA